MMLDDPIASRWSILTAPSLPSVGVGRIRLYNLVLLVANSTVHHCRTVGTICAITPCLVDAELALRPPSPRTLSVAALALPLKWLLLSRSAAASAVIQSQCTQAASTGKEWRES